jgi:hypothetical protein
MVWLWAAALCVCSLDSFPVCHAEFTALSRVHAEAPAAVDRARLHSGRHSPREGSKSAARARTVEWVQALASTCPRNGTCPTRPCEAFGHVDEVFSRRPQRCDVRTAWPFRFRARSVANTMDRSLAQPNSCQAHAKTHAQTHAETHAKTHAKTATQACPGTHASVPTPLRLHNNAKHSATGVAPNNVSSKNEIEIAMKLKKQAKTGNYPDLGAGDQVRLPIVHKTHQGYKQQWTDDL